MTHSSANSSTVATNAAHGVKVPVTLKLVLFFKIWELCFMLCVMASRIPEAPALEMNEANMPHSDPLPRQPDELAEASSTTNKVRQGVTGHNVRYVLLFGTAGAVLAFILVFVAFFG